MPVLQGTVAMKWLQLYPAGPKQPLESLQGKETLGGMPQRVSLNLQELSRSRLRLPVSGGSIGFSNSLCHHPAPSQNQSSSWSMSSPSFHLPQKAFSPHNGDTYCLTHFSCILLVLRTTPLVLDVFRWCWNALQHFCNTQYWPWGYSCTQ